MPTAFPWQVTVCVVVNPLGQSTAATSTATSVMTAGTRALPGHPATPTAQNIPRFAAVAPAPQGSVDAHLVIMLAGGDKRKQTRGIEKARKLAMELGEL